MVELKFICTGKSENLNTNAEGQPLVTANITLTPVDNAVLHGVGTVIGTPNAPIVQPAQSNLPFATSAGFSLTLQGSPEETGQFALGKTYVLKLEEDLEKDVNEKSSKK
jgi:hypothetical protein